MKLTTAALAAVLFALASPLAATAQEAALVHSDEPLWTPGRDEVWPKHLDGPEIGCAHPMRIGDWRYEPNRPDADATWYRLANYGAFHCWINVSEGDEPGQFGSVRPAFLVALGKQADMELWALQIGARPGSDYLLLARPSGAGAIERFSVLQRTCPAGAKRGGQSLDGLQTGYCSVSSKSELISMARRMARLPPLATLVFEKVIADE
jgi:hypothetical protein